MQSQLAQADSVAVRWPKKHRKVAEISGGSSGGGNHLESESSDGGGHGKGVAAPVAGYSQLNFGISGPSSDPGIHREARRQGLAIPVHRTNGQRLSRGAVDRWRSGRYLLRCAA